MCLLVYSHVIIVMICIALLECQLLTTGVQLVFISTASRFMIYEQIIKCYVCIGEEVVACIRLCWDVLSG